MWRGICHTLLAGHDLWNQQEHPHTEADPSLPLSLQDHWGKAKTMSALTALTRHGL